MGNVIARKSQSFLGNFQTPTAWLLIHIRGWSFQDDMRRVESLIESVENVYPDKYQYHIVRDQTQISRMRITLYKCLEDI